MLIWYERANLVIHMNYAAFRENITSDIEDASDG